MLKSPARIQLFSAEELEILAKICASERSLHQLLRLNEHQLLSAKTLEILLKILTSEGRLHQLPRLNQHRRQSRALCFLWEHWLNWRPINIASENLQRKQHRCSRRSSPGVDGCDAASESVFSFKKSIFVFHTKNQNFWSKFGMVVTFFQTRKWKFCHELLISTFSNIAHRRRQVVDLCRRPHDGAYERPLLGLAIGSFLCS